MLACHRSVPLSATLERALIQAIAETLDEAESKVRLGSPTLIQDASGRRLLQVRLPSATVPGTVNSGSKAQVSEDSNTLKNAVRTQAFAVRSSFRPHIHRACQRTLYM